MFNEKTRDILIVIILVATLVLPFVAVDSIKSKISQKLKSNTEEDEQNEQS